MSRGDTYLFIDGGYVRARYDKFARDFPDKPELDWWKLLAHFNARKAFYYDCSDESPKDDEDESDFRVRVDRQRSFLDLIGNTDSFHVRLGSTTEGRKRQQKEVDVHLAVDMLNFAYGGAMDRAVLMAGDLDFRPIVRSLVQHGTYVTVAFDQSSCAKALLSEADARRRITFRDWHNWSADQWTASNALPVGGTISKDCRELGAFRPLKVLVFQGTNRRCDLVQAEGGNFVLVMDQEDVHGRHTLTCESELILLKTAEASYGSYVEQMHGSASL